MPRGAAPEEQRGKLFLPGPMLATASLGGMNQAPSAKYPLPSADCPLVLYQPGIRSGERWQPGAWGGLHLYGGIGGAPGSKAEPLVDCVAGGRHWAETGVLTRRRRRNNGMGGSKRVSRAEAMGGGASCKASRAARDMQTTQSQEERDSSEFWGWALPATLPLVAGMLSEELGRSRGGAEPKPLNEALQGPGTQRRLFLWA